MKKRTTYFIFSVLAVMIFLISFHYYPTLFEVFKPVNESGFEGDSNVFVAKVLEQTGDENVNGGTAAQYKVRVEKNMKGRIHGDVFISESRAVIDGYIPIRTNQKSYQFGGNYNPEKGWYDVIMLSDMPYLKLIMN